MAESVSPERKSHFSPAILIPVYNHESSVAQTVKTVLCNEVPVLLVDDGSDQSCRRSLENLEQQHPQQILLTRLPKNSGKGAAIKHGIRFLQQLGHSHALQIDADGQHDANRIADLIDTSLKNPDALVLAYPQYDASIPRLRFFARYLTHVWVWINTLSTEVIDTMCGFRVYPIDDSVTLLDAHNCGDRMEFDTEFVVRWHWRRRRILQLAARVRYPVDGTSHFRMWRDNMLITAMHTRLFFGMLIRLPSLLRRRPHA